MERETIKEFCKDAISNGYTGYSCNGWDWIRANIQRLDFIFETENYKKQGGMKYKCMPLILEHYPEEKGDALEHLDFAIKEFREMKMQPSLERALKLHP